MAQGIKVLATKPDDLSSIPRVYMAEGENQLPQSHKLFSDLHKLEAHLHIFIK